MKTKQILLVAFTAFGMALSTYAQQLKAGSNPTTIDASSVLEAESTTKGFLPPRMTTAQRNAISNPAKGLIIYDTTLDCVVVNKGTPVAPNWECIGASATPSLIVDCGASRFSLSSPATDPLCQGLFIGTTGYQVKFVLTNNSFAAVSALDLSSAVTLSGAGAAGLSVIAGQNTSVSVGSATSSTITYNLSGSPTTAGVITATFSKLSLTCAISNTVANPATWTGNGLDGTTSALANYSCLAIKNAFPASTDGVYWLDPDGACTAFSVMQAQCDMTTDGGGWTLVGNLTLNTFAPPPTARNSLPVIVGGVGANEVGNLNTFGLTELNLRKNLCTIAVRYEGKNATIGFDVKYQTAGAVSAIKAGNTPTGTQTVFSNTTGTDIGEKFGFGNAGIYQHLGLPCQNILLWGIHYTNIGGNNIYINGEWYAPICAGDDSPKSTTPGFLRTWYK